MPGALKAHRLFMLVRDNASPADQTQRRADLPGPGNARGVAADAPELHQRANGGIEPAVGQHRELQRLAGDLHEIIGYLHRRRARGTVHRGDLRVGIVHVQPIQDLLDAREGGGECRIRGVIAEGQADVHVRHVEGARNRGVGSGAPHRQQEAGGEDRKGQAPVSFQRRWRITFRPPRQDAC